MIRVPPRTIVTLLAALAAGAVGLAARGAAPSPPADGRGFIPAEIILELQPSHAAQARARVDAAGFVRDARSGIASLDALGRRHGLRQMRPILREGRLAAAAAKGSRLAGFFHLKLETSGGELEAIEQYRRDPAVRGAQLNYLYAPDLIPNDPGYSAQYAHQVAHAEAGWSVTTGSPAITIAVIGTGVEASHPDLASKLVPGWDFSDNDPDPSPTGDPHETQVAGVAAAATNNLTGMAGVCWGCRLMALKVDYTTVQVAQALDFARANGARVVNMSFGNYDINKYGPDSAVGAAIDEGFSSGVVIVATAGNDSIDLMRYPGANENVIGVASTDQQDQRASFSNYGSWVDVAAPGAGIYTTTTGNAYAFVNGTSFSAPYVSGLAGLILSKNPSLSPQSVRLMIEYASDGVTADHFIGSGRVNLAATLSLDGPPSPAAVIKSPENLATQSADTVDVRGTALGDGYLLEYKPRLSSAWTTVSSGPETIDGTLGVLDLTGQPGGTYDIRLTATRGANQAQDQTSIVLVRQLQVGWPQSVGIYIFAAPVYADLDNDGRQEIIVAADNGWIYVWRQDGTLMPGWRQFAGFQPLFASPSVGDIDGDGAPEIVVTAYFGARVCAFHRNGTTVAGFPKDASLDANDLIRTSAALVNLDADDALEIVVVTSKGLVHVYQAPGTSERPGWPRTVEGNVQTTPAVGDVDGDGEMEIVIRGYNKIYVFNADGTPVPGWPVETAGAHVSPAIGDVDGDGSVEIIDGGSLGIAVYRGNGTTLFTRPIANGLAYDGFALGDLDGDETLEIFLPARDGRVFGLSSTGALLPGWPVSSAPDFQGGSKAPIIVDIDGDGGKEVFLGDPGGLIQAWNLDGSPALATIDLGSIIWTSLAAGDVDADGDVDLLAGTGDGDLYIFDLPGLWDFGLADWPMFQGDARHTGHYRFAEFYVDSDGDGDPDRTDCQLQNPAVHHGAFEACNGVDEDCTGVADDQDLDHDGITACGGVDCDDTQGTVYPGAPEICGDGLNNDCGDPSWPALPASEADDDSDTFLLCSGDCDDARGTIYPGAPQICGDGLNNDCWHPSWPGLAGTNEVDDDADAFSECQGDCDDSRAGVYPGAAQVCDGINNDCSDPAWPAPTLSDRDGDGDGFLRCADDCDDSWPYTYPGAPQVCGDGRNTDCNDPAWPGLPANELDLDGDSFTPCQGDCDETQAAVYSAAPQICDGLNNDCRTWNWPSTAGTNDGDDDGDGFSECQQDCNDTVAAFWRAPGEARDVVFSPGGETMTWQSPLIPGSTSVMYDVIRTQGAGIDFVTFGVCVESDDGSDRLAADAEYPWIGGVYYYVVRAQNACGAGPAGLDSSGAPRPARSCP